MNKSIYSKSKSRKTNLTVNVKKLKSNYFDTQEFYQLLSSDN